MKKKFTCLFMLFSFIVIEAYSFEILDKFKLICDEKIDNLFDYPLRSVSINDEDRIVITGRDSSYLLDKNDEFQFLRKNPLGPRTNGRIPYAHYEFNKINNNDVLIGYDAEEGLPIFWTSELGAQEVFLKLFIPEARCVNASYFIDINSNNEILGTFESLKQNRYGIFIYKDGIVSKININDDLDKFSKYYFVKPISINDAGYILGAVQFDRYLEERLPPDHVFIKKNEYVKVFQIKIDDKDASNSSCLVKINNRNQVLINYNNNAYVWDDQNGVRLVAEKFKGITFNDLGQVIGVKLYQRHAHPSSQYIVPLQPEFILVNEDGNRFNITEFFSLLNFQVDCVDINNIGHIAVGGEPKKEYISDDDDLDYLLIREKTCYLITK